MRHLSLVAALLLPALARAESAPTQPVGLPQIHAFGDSEFDSDQWIDLQTRVVTLPREGQPHKRPWNAYWWPYKHEGLTHRWISSEEPSPIEKMDAVAGHPLKGTAWEIENHPANVEWGGQCDGFSIASVLEPEPRYPVLYEGICFASGDVKGLLGALYMGDMSGQRVDVLGRNVFDANRKLGDLDPATFFLALTNVMGRLGEGLYADVGKNGEIYNKPLASYSNEVTIEGHVAHVTTTIQVVKYLTVPEVQFSPGRLLVAPTRLTYDLELDEAGNVLPGGGQWTGKAAEVHPSSLKIPRGSPVRTQINDPFIDAERVRELAVRSATAQGPECSPGAATRPGPRS